ncbi:hypothetical protein J3D55_002531 [Chryseobacterium ginsenosidimutans]|uniref:hypothetical protein n=1 Tax=Chryseobacterium ginsenosidimutans TaxID=687846 RepID=UPI0021671768|nr:hypothetical protein [Chryseobacterium ginsenosidimutans]MCS3869615.1 hypothetical protein [Chryseobacterium ginsenosidimutans]
MKNLFKYILLLTIPFLSVACNSDDEVLDNKIPPVMTLFYQNADALAKTYDPNGTVNQGLRNEAFNLYKQGKWSELEVFFKNNNLNGGWPPANGGYNVIDDVSFTAGQKFDRYSGAIAYTGNRNSYVGRKFYEPDC